MPLSKYDITCIREAKKLMDKNSTRHYTIPEIARHAGINATKLKSGFKELFGTGLYKYWQLQRLGRGKRMVENTELSLKHISRELGYKYKNNFDTAFRKVFGKTPAACRKKN